MTKEMCKSTIRKWFELNRADYYAEGIVTDDFLEEVYELIYPDIESVNENEEMFAIANVLQFSFGIEFYKAAFNKVQNIFERQFPEMYDTMNRDKILSLVSKVVLKGEMNGFIMASVIYNDETNEVELDEEILDGLFYDVIDKIIREDEDNE